MHPSAKNTAEYLRNESSKKNSPIIQTALAEIQQQTAKLCENSIASPQLRRAISMATARVGRIMSVPAVRQPQHQHVSLKIHRTICEFSYSRAVLNNYDVFLVLKKLGPGGRFQLPSRRYKLRVLGFLNEPGILDPPSGFEPETSFLPRKCSAA